MCAVFPALKRGCFGKLVLIRCSTAVSSVFSVFTHLMVLGLLIRALMDGLNTDTNVSASPVAAYWCPLQPGMSQQSTERMIDDFQEGLAWNERCNDWGTSLGFVSELFYFWGGCVCTSPPGHPDGSRQLCDQPFLWLSAFTHRRRPGWRICARIRQEDEPKWLVRKHLLETFLLHRSLTQRKSNIILLFCFLHLCRHYLNNAAFFSVC